MSTYKITTDSASDLPKNYVDEHNIVMPNLFYKIEGNVYGGDVQMESHEFYELMRNGSMPTTMATNPEDIKDMMIPLLTEGYDILHIAFSSGLSASCQNSIIAVNELREQFPDRKIIVVDSLAASLGQGLLVHKALQKQAEGLSIEENAKWVEDNKLHICHAFTVNDLFHLHRGGRVSKTAAIVGTLVNIKPVLHVDNEGHLIPLSKLRGRKKSLVALVDKMESDIKGCDNMNDIIFISHGDCEDDAQFVADNIKERLGITNIMIAPISPVIGAHAGPGTVALFYYGTAR